MRVDVAFLWEDGGGISFHERLGHPHAFASRFLSRASPVVIQYLTLVERGTRAAFFPSPLRGVSGIQEPTSYYINKSRVSSGVAVS